MHEGKALGENQIWSSSIDWTFLVSLRSEMKAFSTLLYYCCCAVCTFKLIFLMLVFFVHYYCTTTS